MYMFKIEKKEEYLKGRTIRFIAKNILKCSTVHLGNVLNGKSCCSYSFANNISNSDFKTVEYYFVEREN